MNFNRHYIDNFYYFINYIDDEIKKNILKFKNISLIISKENYNNNPILNNIIKFSKKNNIKFYIQDDYQLAINLGASGLYLSTNNNKIPIISKKNFLLIGHVHSQKQYYFKNLQRCMQIIFSPLFYNKKYNEAQILGISKFNLITLNWKKNVTCLGGVNEKNINQIKMLKVTSIGFKSFIEARKKKPVYFKSRRV